MKNMSQDLLILPIKFEHTNKLLSCIKGEKKSISNSRIWTYRKNAERLTKLIIKREINIVQGTWGEGECKKQKKKSKKRNGLPPAGLADLDPWLWEQTKWQAKSGLKDNNTIQKVSMQHSTNAFVHKHISKRAVFLGLVPPSLFSYFLLYTHHTVLAFISDLLMKHLWTYHAPGTVPGGRDAEKMPGPSGAPALWLWAAWQKRLHLTVCVSPPLHTVLTTQELLQRHQPSGRNCY